MMNIEVVVYIKDEETNSMKQRKSLELNATTAEVLLYYMWLLLLRMRWVNSYSSNRSSVHERQALEKE